MNNKERLLADTLGDGEGASFARAAAAHARRRKIVRHVGSGTGLGLAIAAAFFATRSPREEPSRAIQQTPSVPVLEIISDQELVTQLRDRPVLYLKEKNRITGVVFLTTKETEKKL